MAFKQYAAIIIGSGQGGNPLAMAFAKCGKKTALIESTHIGGCCVNDGCTPTKTIISSGRVAHLAKRAADYGVEVNSVKIDMLKIRQRKRNIVDSFRSGGEGRLKSSGVDVYMGTGRFIDPKTIQVKMNDGSLETCQAETIVINVGERPAIPTLDGFEVARAKAPHLILDSTSIQELDTVPESLLVVGGGYIGLEFGQLFSRLGSKVTIIQRNKRLLPKEDPEITSVLEDILKQDGIQVLTETTPVSISIDQKVSLVVKSKSTSTLTATHILFAAGRTSNSDGLDIAAAGLEVDKRGYILTNDMLATKVAGIYAMGDVRGPPAFTHVSYDDFRILRDQLQLTEESPAVIHSVSKREPVLCYCMFTDPQLAHVGLHVHSLSEEEKRKVQVAVMPMSYVARALETDESRGIMKATVNKETGKILGFTVLGIEGGELMSVVQMAMMGGLKWWDLREAVFAHPTTAECLNNLWGFLKDVD
jgi:pyruvate/2-oxoglutarate dehydrogenase complex dihydrolipoamide dehydrogenase (E3) component